MSKTLVWITHSFRENSKLTASLSGECAFAYYSPYYFAGKREREIYKNCSQENIDVFHESINSLNSVLVSKGGVLNIFKEFYPVSHINNLIDEYEFTNVIVDKTLFAMWHTIDLTKIKVPVTIIDSDLIDSECNNMTAKARWTRHVKQTYVPYKFSDTITFLDISKGAREQYPSTEKHEIIDAKSVMEHALEISKTYSETRDKHNGQTKLSTALHNGVLDPREVFFTIANQFIKDGHDINDSEGPASAILRQLAFREISIIRTHKANMTLENTPVQWAKALMHISAYENMMNARPNINSKVNIASVSEAKTGDKDLDFLLSKLIATGVMPNRARMYYASKVFYESPTGLSALETTIGTFDLLGLDGQSPNNYVQCTEALGLSYGKVLKMNRDTAFNKLGY